MCLGIIPVIVNAIHVKESEAIRAEIEAINLVREFMARCPSESARALQAQTQLGGAFISKVAAGKYALFLPPYVRERASDTRANN
jgi:hypothetical protein